ncbi:hypothetical protein BST61_g6311 [Cercospora zeina]
MLVPSPHPCFCAARAHPGAHEVKASAASSSSGSIHLHCTNCCCCSAHPRALLRHHTLSPRRRSFTGPHSFPSVAAFQSSRRDTATNRQRDLFWIFVHPTHPSPQNINMKAGLLVAALAATATAQLHRRGHRHARRDNPPAYQQEVQVVTELAKHVVYVDSNGNPINAPAQTAAPAPAPPAYQPPAYQPPAYQPPAYQPPPAAYQAPPAPAPSATAAPAPEPQPGGGEGQGIVYSPYNNDKTCKTQDQVTADFEKLDGYSLVRIYGCDCNQVVTVRNAATAKGMKIFLGIFDLTLVSTNVQQIVAAANGDWSWVDTVSVGNELVNNGAASVGDVVNAVNTARSLLRAAGYQGPVVTVDTFVAIIANPQLCQASDYAAANCHAFFDGGKTADQAADFVADQAQRVQQACGGKRTVITESGWPWQGASNGVAVPSKQNQATVISGLKSKFQKDIFLFTAFDDLWKDNFSGSHGAECYWGFIEQSS